MLLIYLFASMKLEKGHKKLLGSSFKIMLHCDILWNRLNIIVNGGLNKKIKYYSLERNVFSILILFRYNSYNVN